MEKAEWDALQATLARVKKTMDQRFEKDAELYIDQPNIEWLKRKLREKNYELIKDRLTSGLAPEALTRVIVENAWLLPNDTRQDAYRPLFDIMRRCRAGYLSGGDLVAGVLSGSYDMPEAFHTELAELCLSEIEPYRAQAMLDNGAQNLPFLNNLKLWIACLRTAFSKLEPMDKYRKFTACALNKTGAYAQTQWKSLNRIFDKPSLTDDVLDVAFIDNFRKDHSPGYYYWRFVFGSRCEPEALPERLGKVFLKAGIEDFSDCRRLWLSVVPAITREEMMDAMAEIFRKVSPQWHANRLDKLADVVVSSLSSKKPEFASKAAKAFGESGIHINIQNDDDLPDLQEIARELNDPAIKDGKLRYLAKAFKFRYSRGSPVDSLNELKGMVEGFASRNFERFCYILTASVPYQYVVPYLIYIMDNFQNQAATNLILQIIQQKDIFHARQTKVDKGALNRLKSFVQDHDFDLYKKLMS